MGVLILRSGAYYAPHGVLILLAPWRIIRLMGVLIFSFGRIMHLMGVLIFFAPGRIMRLMAVLILLALGRIMCIMGVSIFSSGAYYAPHGCFDSWLRGVLCASWEFLYIETCIHRELDRILLGFLRPSTYPNSPLVESSKSRIQH
ncbi:UNVERIFIED_CONTAM: hypothetical protein Sradi_6866800 [Sesamum radiatum]|uniref:Uncharacterized protein n=1 Tax=Sesamum radiatum TaxID=300843 RepID=A0AAW2JKH9_SESRA